MLAFAEGFKVIRDSRGAFIYSCQTSSACFPELERIAFTLSSLFLVASVYYQIQSEASADVLAVLDAGNAKTLVLYTAELFVSPSCRHTLQPQRSEVGASGITPGAPRGPAVRSSI